MTPIYLSIAAAVLPTVLYVLLFYWADRYEREPLTLLAAAFVWGALPAVAVSLLVEFLFELPRISNAGNNTLVANVLIAPIVEETAKWLALLAIYFFKRQEFDGPLDGLIYGALIGFGFAMTENILFFIGAVQQGGYAALSSAVFMRSIVFGMNHAFYTALAGIALGIAVSTDVAITRTLWIGAGLLLAIVAHSLHNLGAAAGVGGPNSLLLSLTIGMISLLLIVLTVLWSWQHERMVIRTQLRDEVDHVVTRDEYSALLQRWRRPVRPGRAGGRSGRQTQATRRQLSVELALCKARFLQRGDSEPQLAQEIRRLRTQLAEGMYPAATYRVLNQAGDLTDAAIS